MTQAVCYSTWNRVEDILSCQRVSSYKERLRFEPCLREQGISCVCPLKGIRTEFGLAADEGVLPLILDTGATEKGLMEVERG